MGMDFRPTSNPFRFEKEIVEDFSVELDFLSEPEALENIPQEYIRVQEDLDAVIISGSSIVFKLNFKPHTHPHTPIYTPLLSPSFLLSSLLS